MPAMAPSWRHMRHGRFSTNLHRAPTRRRDPVCAADPSGPAEPLAAARALHSGQAVAQPLALPVVLNDLPGEPCPRLEGGLVGLRARGVLRAQQGLSHGREQCTLEGVQIARLEGGLEHGEDKRVARPLGQPQHLLRQRQRLRNQQPHVGVQPLRLVVQLAGERPCDRPRHRGGDSARHAVEQLARLALAELERLRPAAR
mmetsp:Transcript_42035/g.137130  ORF Transcript_42035/g.137130 Transcript_42035/m.137130 type:complete len:200 (-) Transcript_42035:522-1121(-)